jgi:hypothetical protein
MPRTKTSDVTRDESNHEKNILKSEFSCNGWLSRWFFLKVNRLSLAFDLLPETPLKRLQTQVLNVRKHSVLLPAADRA